MAARYLVQIDWWNNGTFTDAGDEVTARVLDNRTPVAIRYGRDQARALSPIAVGEASFELNNLSRDYSPENTASPLNGLVQPGRPVRVQAVLAGVTTTIYTGYLDDFVVKPDLEARSVDVSCTDSLGQMSGSTVFTELYASIRTGEAIHRILDAVGWPAAARDIDPGATVMPWWWVDGDDALTALLQLADSEGPSALISVDSTGRIVFRDRHHRLTRAASLTAQSTWRSGGNAEPLFSSPATYGHGWKEIVNSVAFDVTVRRPDTGTSVVWSSLDPIIIPAGDTVTVTASSNGGFSEAVVPEDGTDFQTLSGGVFVALSRTSGGSTDIRLTAASGTSVITGLQLRARALLSSVTAVSAEDPTSIAQFGRRSLPGDRTPAWVGIYDARAIAELILGKRSVRVPTITVSMRGGNNTRLGQQLTRNLSDRVRVVETHTGLDADCFIEQISHSIGEGGAQHTTTFGLEKAPVPITNAFTFDVAGRGFDQGRFPGWGYDEPGSMFRFDTAGQGFDQGLFVN